MSLSDAACYEIRVKGHVAPRWSEWFYGLAMMHTEDGDTILAGQVADQAALHGLLLKVRDLNLTLVSVTPCPEAADGGDQPPQGDTSEEADQAT